MKKKIFATAILVGPMVLCFLRFCYYGGDGVSVCVITWVVEEVLAILTVLSTATKKNTFSVIALILNVFCLFLCWFWYICDDILCFFDLIFSLGIIILNCKSLKNNHTVRVKKEATCPHCGSLLAPGKKFCINCGAKIDVENDNQNMESKGE